MGMENFGIAEVKAKINTLRSTYAQELKKVRESNCSGAGTLEIYTPSLNWFKEMADFLQTSAKITISDDNAIQVPSEVSIFMYLSKINYTVDTL